MIIYPQETKAKRGENIDRITDALISVVTLNSGVLALEGSDSTVYALVEGKNVPPFTLPVDIVMMSRSATVVDLRKQQREYTVGTMGTTYMPLGLSDAEFLSDLAILQRIWVKSLTSYKRLFNTTAKLYAGWVASTLGSRLALPFQDIQLLTVLSAYFFLSREIRVVIPPINEYVLRLKSIVNQVAVSDIANIMQAVDGKPIGGIDDFCQLVVSLTENPKLRSFTPALFYQYMYGSWKGGANPQEMTAVALEYPPVFVNMVYRGLQARSYKDTGLVLKVNNTLRGQREKDEYVRLVKMMLVDGRATL